MTREQQRAGLAARLASEVGEELAEKGKKRFNTLAHKLPIFLRTNGLLQTAAFLEAKSRGDSDRAKGTRRLLDGLKLGLEEAGFPRPKDSVSSALVRLDDLAYVRWQEEAVRCAVWLKRFSAAQLGEPEDDEGKEG